MTDEKLEKLETQRRRLVNLQAALSIADKTPEYRRKLEALFEVSGWIQEDTLKKCYDLVRPELDAAFVKLEKEWEDA